MERLIKTCENPWCKAHFYYTEADMIEVKSDSRSFKIDNVLDEVQKVAPRECPKCRSFATELSGGVEWKDKEYEGSRFDGMPHQIKYKVTNYKL
jgi:hypothetical protein